MLSARMRELEEVSRELQKVLLSDWADGLLRRGLDKRLRADQGLLATQATAAALAGELAAAEEKVAQALLEREGRRQGDLRRLRGLQEELERARGAAASLHASNSALRAELEELREQSRRLEQDPEREEEEEEEAVPSAAYVTQLYYKISRIDWDYEAEPAQIKGIHYGPDIAQPIDIDGSRHSRCFVSDYLWSLVPTAW